MAQTTLLSSITRSASYPVDVQGIEASSNCGTLQLILGSDWTMQMIHELPAINIGIYTSDGAKYLDFDIDMSTVNSEYKNKERSLEPIDPYSIAIYNIPESFTFRVTPLFDKYALEAHNDMIDAGEIQIFDTTDKGIVDSNDDNYDSQKWLTPTDTFDITIVFDNSNVSSSGGGGGGGSTPTAADVTYDGSTSGLTATNVQDAIDELDQTIEELPEPITDYNDLQNKPSINSVELVGNKSLSDLGLANPMTIKGKVATVADLSNIPNPQPGWVYFVGAQDASELQEYVYIESGESYDEYTVKIGYPNYGEDIIQSLWGNVASLPTPARKITIEDVDLPTATITFTPDSDFEGIFERATQISYTGDTPTPGDGYVYRLDYDAMSGHTITKLNQASQYRVGSACAPTDGNGTFALTVANNDYAILSEPVSTAAITKDQSVTAYHISFTPSSSFTGFTENGAHVTLTGDTIVNGDNRIYSLDYSSSTGYVITAYGDQYVVGPNFVQRLDTSGMNVTISDCAWAPTKVVIGSWQLLGYNNIVIDSELSTTSENPVQNKVITAALNDKVNTEAGKSLSTNDYTNAEKASVALSAEILTPISESAYEALTTKDKPLYFIYD